MRRTALVFSLVGVATVAACLLVAFPSALGVSTLLPFVYAASFRSVVAVALLTAGGVGLLCLVAVRLGIRRGLIGPEARRAKGLPPRPPAFAHVRLTPLFTLVSAIVAVAGLASLGVSGARGWSPSAPPTAFADADLVVLNANTLEAATPAATLAETARTYDVDVLAVQEVDAAYAAALAEALERGGRAYDVTLDSATHVVGQHRTALLTPRDWGAPQAIPSVYGTARIEATRGPIGAVHTVSPLSDSVLDGSWASSVEDTAAQCPARPGSILAGDFNSTLDHAPFGSRGTCRDAAADLGLGGRGTWRQDVPEVAASGIDHQIYDPGAWDPVAGAYIPLPESDHRGLVVGYSAKT